MLYLEILIASSVFFLAVGCIITFIVILGINMTLLQTVFHRTMELNAILVEYEISGAKCHMLKCTDT